MKKCLELMQTAACATVNSLPNQTANLIGLRVVDCVLGFK
jgi:hypothetical protein